MRAFFRGRRVAMQLAMLGVAVSCGDEPDGPKPPVATKIEAASSTAQTASAGASVQQPPTVIARAADGTPVPGVSITFTSTGGGTIAPAGPVTTDAIGVAALTSWTLTAQPGSAHTVSAAAAGLAGSPVTFAATVLGPTTIEKVSGDNQSAVVGTALSQPIAVRVKDANNVTVPNVSVTFLAANGGTAAPSPATTNENGAATTSWTLGPAVGPQSLSASITTPAGTQSVSFQATATAATATAIAKVAGDNQQAPPGTELAVQPRVRLTSANGTTRVAGVSVSFAPTAGSGTVSAASVVTDANGEATTRWTLSSTAGQKTLTASAGALSTTFTATATTPQPGSLQIVSGNNQSGRTSTALASQVVVRLLNTGGGAMPGATVTFTPTAGSGTTFAPASATTDAAGEVRTTWTLGASLGTTYTATVASAGVTPVTISATATQLSTSVGVFKGIVVQVRANKPNVPVAATIQWTRKNTTTTGSAVAGSDGRFTTQQLAPGTYLLEASSQVGVFPVTIRYEQVLPGGAETDIGNFRVPFNGFGPIEVTVTLCPAAPPNTTAVVKVFQGVNGDVGGGEESLLLLSGGKYSTSVGFEVYVLTVTAPGCSPYRAEVVHSPDPASPTIPNTTPVAVTLLP